MTYSYSGPWSSPGPQAPLAWTTAVIDFARTIVPASKIYMGLPFYGFDWHAGSTTAVQASDAAALIAAHHFKVAHDPASGEADLSYVDTSRREARAVVRRPSARWPPSSACWSRPSPTSAASLSGRSTAKTPRSGRCSPRSCADDENSREAGRRSRRSRGRAAGGGRRRSRRAHASAAAAPTCPPGSRTSRRGSRRRRARPRAPASTRRRRRR